MDFTAFVSGILRLFKLTQNRKPSNKQETLPQSYETHTKFSLIPSQLNRTLNHGAPLLGLRLG